MCSETERKLRYLKIFTAWFYNTVMFYFVLTKTVFMLSTLTISLPYAAV